MQRIDNVHSKSLTTDSKTGTEDFGPKRTSVGCIRQKTCMYSKCLTADSKTVKEDVGLKRTSVGCIGYKTCINSMSHNRLQNRHGRRWAQENIRSVYQTPNVNLFNGCDNRILGRHRRRWAQEDVRLVHKTENVRVSTQTQCVTTAQEDVRLVHRTENVRVFTKKPVCDNSPRLRPFGSPDRKWTCIYSNIVCDNSTEYVRFGTPKRERSCIYSEIVCDNSPRGRPFGSPDRKRSCIYSNIMCDNSPGQKMDYSNQLCKGTCCKCFIDGLYLHLFSLFRAGNSDKRSSKQRLTVRFLYTSG